jgi:short-subunit dehydrogenase
MGGFGPCFDRRGRTAVVVGASSGLGAGAPAAGASREVKALAITKVVRQL